MSISSLVVTLDADPGLRQRALVELAAMPGVTIGEPRATRLPMVVEAATLEEGYRFVEQQLRRVSGVQFVEVVRIDFEESGSDRG